MDAFWKALSGVLIAVILGLAVGKQEKDFSVLLSLAACCLTTVIAMSYLRPVVDFLCELNAMGKMETGFVSILLKAVGIALISELVCMICADAGNGTLGKTLQILTNVVILSLSLPVFRALVTLIQKILGEI